MSKLYTTGDLIKALRAEGINADSCRIYRWDKRGMLVYSRRPGFHYRFYTKEQIADNVNFLKGEKIDRRYKDIPSTIGKYKRNECIY